MADYRVRPVEDAAAGGKYRGIDFANAACGACLNEKCGTAFEACYGEPSCASYLKCDALNGDVDGQSLCMGIHGPTLRSHEAWDLLNCRADKCTNDCGLPCNGTCLGNQGCDRCLASSCASSGAALAASADATRMLACGASMIVNRDQPAPWISKRCASMHDSGSDAFDAWDTCRRGSCEGPCGTETSVPDWLCLDQISPPVPKRGLETISFDVAAYNPLAQFDSAHIFDARVSACKLGGRCSPGGAIDPDGFFPVSVGASESAFFDYLELEPTAAGDAGVVVDTGPIHATINYEFPPVTQSGVELAALTGRGKLPSGGYVVILPYSCGLTFHAPGVRFETSLPGAGLPFYLSSPSSGLPDPNLEMTEGAAVGGFASPPAGSNDGGTDTTATFYGYRADTDGGRGQLVFRVNNVLVRPGAATFIIVTPSPHGGW